MKFLEKKLKNVRILAKLLKYGHFMSKTKQFLQIPTLAENSDVQVEVFTIKKDCCLVV